MNSTLPSRWQEILRREAAANVGTVLAQAREQPEPHRLPRWTVPALVVGVASMSAFALLGQTEARGKGNLPFDRSTVISTRTAGLGASAEDLAPHAAAVAKPTVLADPAEISPPEPLRARRSPSLDKSGPACPECERRRAALARLEPTPEPDPTATPAAPVAEAPPPLVVNIGTRIKAVLSDPVVTGAALAPASATLTEDVVVGDRVAIPVGTVLVGEGFATQQDDRAQVVFSAVVKDGKTLPIEGWALQNGEIGVKGKVVRKASKGKSGAGAVLGAAASALTFGLSGAVPGAGGAALSSLGNTAAYDLAGLGRDWRRSDKVVRVEAGIAVVVYIRRDLTIE